MGHGPAHAFRVALGLLQFQGEAVYPALREAVALLEADALAPEGLPHGGGAGGAAGDGEADGGEVGPGEALRLQEHLVHGGHQEEDGGPVEAEEFQVLLGAEALLHHHLGPQVEEGGGQGVQGGVEHGGGEDVPVLPGEPPGEDGLYGVHQKLPIGEEGPLGQARGAPGEEEEGGVLQVHPHLFPGLLPFQEGLEGKRPWVQGLGHPLEPLPVEEDLGLGVGVEGLELGET